MNEPLAAVTVQGLIIFLSSRRLVAFVGNVVV